MWKEFIRTAWLLVFVMTAGQCVAQSAPPPKPPSISHDPVTLAAQGQPLTVLARITPGSGRIRTATLHYSTSRDSAPIKQVMTTSGAGMYLGTIPARHLTGVTSLRYYIEAVDENEEWSETQWQDVRVGGGRSVTEPVILANGSGARGSSGTGISKGKLIAGGALAAGAAIAIVAASDSGGGGGGGASTNAPPPDPSPTPDPTPSPDPDPVPEPDPTPTDCVEADAVGTWINTNPTFAPGFRIQADGSAIFFAPPDGDPDTGSWGLVGCSLTLIPLNTNSVYRTTGSISADKTSFTASGATFIKSN
jgi:hypothetical protein